jgi:hypothetical protein
VIIREQREWIIAMIWEVAGRVWRSGSRVSAQESG